MSSRHFLNKTLLLENSVRKYTDSAFVFSYNNSWQSLLNWQLRKSLNNADGTREAFASTVNSKPELETPAPFFPACVLIEVCSHSLNFSSIFLHSSFAFHFVQKPQQDTILVPPTRACLIEGKSMKLPFYLFIFLTKEEEAGGNDCGCQEGAGNWGRRALSPQPFSKSVFSGLLLKL